jgi:hypothetical protein
MDMRLVNEAFNEALEEMSEEGGERFSVEFVRHHEAVLTAKMQRYRQLNHFQNFAFMALLIVLVLAVRRRWINFDFLALGNTTLIMLVAVWLLIGLNSVSIAQRNKKMLEIEKQLLLIDVYKKILEKEAADGA